MKSKERGLPNWLAEETYYGSVRKRRLREKTVPKFPSDRELARDQRIAIDGSDGMSGPGKIGARMARNRR